MSEPDTAIGGGASRFPETRLTIIEALRSAEPLVRERGSALLADCYWKPLYKYLRLRWGKSNEEAKDLTQDFLLHALQRESLSTYDPSKASFRTFLRLLLDRFAANDEKSRERLRRGGGLTAVDFESAEQELQRLDGGEDPELLLEREWVRGFFEGAVEALRLDRAAAGRAIEFEVFSRYDLAGEPRPKYRELASSLGLSEASVTNHLAAARRRLRELLIDRLRAVTATEEEFRREARTLFGVEP